MSARPSQNGETARPVLMLSSNGIGLGHLSRQLAVGSRLPRPFLPVFYSQSTGIRLARQAGYLAAHIQHHRYNGLEIPAWNQALGRDLLAFARHLRPVAVVVDCTVIFGGFIKLLEAVAGQIPRIWIRRGFLAEDHVKALEAARHFDHIIEPGDLAADYDAGPSAALRDQVTRTPPVLYTAPEDCVPRKRAKEELGLSSDRPCIALMLGHTLGDRTGPIRETLCRTLAQMDVEVLDIQSTLEPQKAPPPGPANLRRAALYPAFRWSKAFDAIITLAGYNAFHESLLGKIPTLFLVWPQPGMDRQDLRVAWAKDRGLALGLDAEPLSRGDDSALAAALRDLMSGRLSAALSRKDAPNAENGAEVLARLIAKWAEGAQPWQGQQP